MDDNKKEELKVSGQQPVETLAEAVAEEVAGAVRREKKNARKLPLAATASPGRKKRRK